MPANRSITNVLSPKCVIKTSSGEIGLNIRTHASPKLGQDPVSRGASVLCCQVKNTFNTT